MDIYIITLECCRKIAVEVDNCLMCHHALFPGLTPRKLVIFGISIVIDDQVQIDSVNSATWKVLPFCEDNILPLEDNTIRASLKSASSMLRRLADALPTAGTFSLKVVCDFANKYIFEREKSAEVLNTLKMLCSLHQGNLNVFTDCSLLCDSLSIYKCLDCNCQIHPIDASGDLKFKLLSNEVWSGSLSVPTPNEEQVIVPGFTLLLPVSIPKHMISIESSYLELPKDYPCHVDESSLWLDNKVFILSAVDVASLPISSYSGINLEISCQVNAQSSEQGGLFQHMHDILSISHFSSYLCRLRYAVLNHAHSAGNSKQHSYLQKYGVTSGYANVNKPKSNKTSNLHFLWRLSNKSTDVHCKGVLTFVCHVLNAPNELDCKALRDYLQHPSMLSTPTLSSMPNDIPQVQLIPLINRYNYIKRSIRIESCELLEKEILSSISADDLSSIIQQSVDSVNTNASRNGKRKVCFPVMCEGDDNFNRYELEKKLLTFGGRYQPTSLGHQIFHHTGIHMDLTPGGVFDQFFLYHHFKCDVSSNKTPNRKSDVPTAVKDFYKFDSVFHGVQYNVDEQEAERCDETNRRLVKKYVKYPTLSIGSAQGFHSQSIIHALSAQLKKSSLEHNAKKSHLVKVAEKLHKKRIQKINSKLLEESKAIGAKFQICPPRIRNNKRKLKEIIIESLANNGVSQKNKDFRVSYQRLYNVCMAFLRNLKSSRDLERIMRETVSKNIHSVLSFDVK